MFEYVVFKVDTIDGEGRDLVARIWNIGLRPLSPELIRLRDIVNRHEPEELMAIKIDWADLLCQLAKVSLIHTGNLDSATHCAFAFRK